MCETLLKMSPSYKRFSTHVLILMCKKVLLSTSLTHTCTQTHTYTRRLPNRATYIEAMKSTAAARLKIEKPRGTMHMRLPSSAGPPPPLATLQLWTSVEITGDLLTVGGLVETTWGVEVQSDRANSTWCSQGLPPLPKYGRVGNPIVVRYKNSFGSTAGKKGSWSSRPAVNCH